ncbi:MAG: LysR family transcriptional regulator [Alphaproteobacteria bacterium]|nr:LysR family transcriptional regulator [Alphaproteobacteria bacterium]MDX5370767.1 LysR family transcriptional regulator [Alphaproteobacteria bacterium]MDX5465181.1 LysR family transcriptional regulator [Alphaproteobacteria bacterium]
MDWDKLRVFHAVAEAGSFTHAGENLGLSQSAVSRQISSLEDSLGVHLFHRHARGLILTEQGDLLFKTAHDVFGKLALTEALLRDSKEKPRGDLRITTTVGFGSTWLTPRMKEFVDLYPDIRVQLILDERELDLGMREADVAIRMWKPVQPDLIQRKFIEVNHHIYASAGYLAQHGTPHALEELDRHQVIIYGEQVSRSLKDLNWLLTAGLPPGQRRDPILRVNNIYGVLLAVESGLGLASLPDYLGANNPNLVRVMPEVEGPSFTTYLAYPEELRNSKRVVVLRDFLLQQTRDWRF